MVSHCRKQKVIHSIYPTQQKNSVFQLIGFSSSILLGTKNVDYLKNGTKVHPIKLLKILNLNLLCTIGKGQINS